MNKQKVAFVCVHNSCRSQMAEAIGKLLASDTFECFSAGTEVVPQINQDAVRLIQKLYQYDMNEHQYSKLISELPAVDIVITMGCNVNCPILPCKFREDWGLDDPTGKGELAFEETARVIKEKLLELKKRFQRHEE